MFAVLYDPLHEAYENHKVVTIIWSIATETLATAPRAMATLRAASGSYAHPVYAEQRALVEREQRVLNVRLRNSLAHCCFEADLELAGHIAKLDEWLDKFLSTILDELAEFEAPASKAPAPTAADAAAARARRSVQYGDLPSDFAGMLSPQALSAVLDSGRATKI